VLLGSADHVLIALEGLVSSLVEHGVCAMKPIVLEFVGGYWDGKTLRTDSRDDEEQLMAAACYEMSHHGAIGGECVELSYDAVGFCRRHGWAATEEASLCVDHRYLVTERRETETEIVITFKYHPMQDF